jgi:putative DNA primase/helicase
VFKMALDSIHQDLTALQQFCLRVGKQPYIKDSQYKNSFTSTGWPLNSKDWLSFSEALEATQKPAKVFHDGTMQPVTGIGFLVARSTQDTRRPLGGDLDCCRDPETGYISPWARAFLQKVKPFYAEVSPSKCGLRFFTWGHLPGGVDSIFGNGPDDLPEDTRERILEIKPTARDKLAKGEPAFNGLEFYESGRHLTITGDRLEEFCYPSEDQTEAIKDALEPFVMAEAVNRVAEGARTSSRGMLPELDILAVIDTSGFTESGGQLFGSHPTEGSTTGRNLVVNPGQNVYCWMHNGINAGGDPWVWLACESEAVAWEQAGPGVLKDASVMKRTLEHAVKRGLVLENVLGTPAAMSPAEALLLAEDLRKKVNTDPGAPFEQKFTQALAVLQAVKPAEYQRIMADLKGKTSIRDLRKTIKQTSTKLSAAKRRAKAEAAGLKLEDICNIDYDEKGDISSVTLAPTRAAAAIEEYLTLAMSKDSDEIYYLDNGIYHTGGDRLIDMSLCGEAGDAVDFNKLREVLRRVRNSLLCNPVTFDPDPYLLGCKNGVVDLRTGEFRDYLPSDYITDQIAVTYNKSARCVRFLQFLEEVLPNPVDRLMLIDWLTAHAIREMLPYVMFLLGLGRNGKGIYERLLKKFFKDESFSEMQLEELSVKNNRFAGAALKGMRGQIVSEAGEEQRKGTKKVIPTSFLKFSTGDGTIDSDQKREKRVRFKPFQKATIDCNDMPMIADRSKGWEERFCKADMPFSYVDNPDPTNPLERQKDPDLFDKLTTDEALSGILNLIISRAPAIIKTKTITKRSGAEMFAEYQRQSSSVLTFLEMFCDYKPVSDSKKDIYLDMIFEKYEQWCDITVADKVDDKRFGKAVKAFCKGIEPERQNDGDKKRKIYHGLSFDMNRYQANKDHYSTINGPLKPITGPLGPLNDEKYTVMWENIVKTFGEERKNISSSEEMKNSSFLASMVPMANSKNTIGRDSGSIGPQDQSNGPDSDLPTMSKIDRPTPESNTTRIRGACVAEYGLMGG